MNDLPNFIYINNNKSDVLTVLLHGSGIGMDSQFMVKLQKAFEKVGDSVISFNFPFFDRGDDHSSGPELKEEIETLKQILKHCEADRYKKIRLVGKSLGGIIASYYLNTLTESEMEKYEVVVFGYVAGGIKLQKFPGKITIIQGEMDKYGNIADVKNDLSQAVSKDITYVEIPNADHSYRAPNTKEPLYEDIAIEKYFK